MRLRQAGLQQGCPPANWQSFLRLAEIEQELAEVRERGGEIRVNREPRRKRSSAWSFRSSARTAVPRFVRQVASSGRNASAARNESAASPWRPRASKHSPRLLKTPGSLSPRPSASRQHSMTRSCWPRARYASARVARKTGGMRHQRRGPSNQLNRQHRLAELKPSNPQQMQRIRVRSIAVQKRLIQPGRGNELARLVKLDRTGEFVA